VVLSRLAIGDLATQYFADRGIFCAGRVMEEDLQRVAKATGARMQTTVNPKVDPAVLGTCERFEEKQASPCSSELPAVACTPPAARARCMNAQRTAMVHGLTRAAAPPPRCAPDRRLARSGTTCSWAARKRAQPRWC
jgi:hypothetical protein